MRRSGALGAGLVVALGWAFQGCSGKSSLTGDAAGGGGGASGSSTGGASGKGAKGGGSIGGAAGVAGLVGGTAGVAGAGGSVGGVGGVVGVAGGVGGVAGVAGVAGDAGAAGFTFDDVCDCGGDEGFTCTITLEALAERLPTPSDCWNDYNFVTRTYCEGYTKYRFLEGHENNYHLEVDDTGSLTFGSASGYVGWVCGIEGEPEFGRVTAGIPSEYECFDECKICAPWEESSEAELPQCLSCTPTPGSDPDDRSVTLSLEEYCSSQTCPTTLLEVEERFAKPCGEADPQLEHIRCGVTIVSREVTSERYYFDQITGALLGMRKSDNPPGGPCAASDYVIGDVSAEACSAEVLCEICESPNAEGAAGAGGESGAAGASGTHVVRTCPAN